MDRPSLWARSQVLDPPGYARLSSGSCTRSACVRLAAQRVATVTGSCAADIIGLNLRGASTLMNTSTIDSDTERAARLFMGRIEGLYRVDQALLFGSRARRSHRQDSGADIAVVIAGEHRKRSTVAVDMAEIAFEVLLDTGVLIEALPLWSSEFEHPERFCHRALIENIRREGIKLPA